MQRSYTLKLRCAKSHYEPCLRLTLRIPICSLPMSVAATDHKLHFMEGWEFTWETEPQVESREPRQAPALMSVPFAAWTDHFTLRPCAPFGSATAGRYLPTCFLGIWVGCASSHYGTGCAVPGPESESWKWWQFPVWTGAFEWGILAAWVKGTFQPCFESPVWKTLFTCQVVL